MNSSAPSTTSRATLETLERWHGFVSSAEMSRLPEILSPDVIFSSPVVFKPYNGPSNMTILLATVVTVFSDFQYHRQMWTADGSSVTLEFTAKVDGLDIKGVDIVRFDANGKIAEFEVLVRPLKAAQALASAMLQRLPAAG